MSINIQCDGCGERRRVNERLAGRTIRCPGCESPIVIPELAEEPVVETPAIIEAVEAEVVSAEPVEAIAVEAVAADAVAVPAMAVAGVAGSDVFSDGVQDTAAVGLVGSDPTSHAEPAPAPKPDDDDDDGVPPRKKRDDGELDMTPMVDVTFLLLIFFMVTASFSLQKSIQMPRQTSDLPSMSNVEEETEELDPVELEIDEFGAFLVLAPDWEREPPGKQNLTSALKEAIGDNRDGMKLNIKVHENAKLQFLVDGMDAGTIAGFTELQVTEVDGFD